jgi:hypothetical protein
LVSAAETYKVHIVSADMKRSKGVAVEFAARYGPVDMTAHSFKVGDIHLQTGSDGTCLLNLVSKNKYHNKFAHAPERFLSNLGRSIESLKAFCVQNKIQRLALVRIGSRTDRVHWRWTQRKILDVFSDVDIDLVVYLQSPSGPHKHSRRFHRTPGTPVLNEAAFPALPQPKTTALLEKAAVNLAGLHGSTAGARSGSVLVSRPEAPGPRVLPKVVSAADGAPCQLPPTNTGTSPFPVTDEVISGGGSNVDVNAPDAASVFVEDFGLQSDAENPGLLAGLDGHGALLTDPHGGTVDASSLAQVRGSGAVHKAARPTAEAVGHLASTTHQSPATGEIVSNAFSRTPGAERIDTPSLFDRLSGSATRCVTMRRRDLRMSGRHAGDFRSSSGSATGVNDMLLFSPAQEVNEEDDQLRHSLF